MIKKSKKITLSVLFLGVFMISPANAGLIGKGGLYDYKLLFTQDGATYYRVYCVSKNGMFSVSNHRPVYLKNGRWYDMIEQDKYLGMLYDGLNIKDFGEKTCK